jgi:hypothetical protein
VLERGRDFGLKEKKVRMRRADFKGKEKELLDRSWIEV